MLQKSGYALDAMSWATQRLHYFLFEGGGGVVIFLPEMEREEEEEDALEGKP